MILSNFKKNLFFTVETTFQNKFIFQQTSLGFFKINLKLNFNILKFNLILNFKFLIFNLNIITLLHTRQKYKFILFFV